jgi:RND family efflux transporter MFP subunit
MSLPMVLALAALVGAGCQGASTGPRAVLAPAATPIAAAERAAAEPAEPGFIGVVVAGEWAEIEAKVEGRIEQVFVRAGDVVARGANIARLDIEASEHELAIARAGFAEASRRLGRRRKLARGRLAAVTPEEVDQARREMVEARARLAKLTQAIDQALVTAPFDGTVAERYLAPGALAGPGRPIARLLGRGEPRVRFAIPEERAGSVSVGSMVSVTIGPAGLPARGVVTGLAPEVDVSSRMVFAAATLEPAPALPGTSAEPLSTGLLARVFVVKGRR